MEHSGGDTAKVMVEDAATRLGVTVDEIWRLINTGELSLEEKAGGLWTIPEWSLNYLLADRARATGTATKTPKAVALPTQAPAPEKKKSKKRDPAKKWKQRFDKLGQEKNEINRRLRASWQAKDDPQSEARNRELEKQLSKVKRDLIEHVKAGVEAGFIDPPKPRSRRAKKKKSKAAPEAKTSPGLDLDELGLQVGVLFSKEREILNAFDPRRQLESWEKPKRARDGSYQRPHE